MSKKVVLVGHCGADCSYLRLAVQSATKNATVVPADDDAELRQLIVDGTDLLLVNRQLDYGFAAETGLALLEKLKATHPRLNVMLISNHADAQAEAIAAGALPGFGKGEIGSPRVAQLLRDALQE